MITLFSFLFTAAAALPSSSRVVVVVVVLVVEVVVVVVCIARGPLLQNSMAHYRLRSRRYHP